MAGTRTSVRAQNPAYRTCTYDDGCPAGVSVVRFHAYSGPSAQSVRVDICVRPAGTVRFRRADCRTRSVPAADFPPAGLQAEKRSARAYGNDVVRGRVVRCRRGGTAGRCFAAAAGRRLRRRAFRVVRQFPEDAASGRKSAGRPSGYANRSIRSAAGCFSISFSYICSILLRDVANGTQSNTICL